MPLVPLFSEDDSGPESPGLVTYQQVLALDLRARVGWLVNIIEKVLGLYSEYFLRESLADEFIAFSWRFAESGEGSAEEANALSERLRPLFEEDASDFQHVYHDAIRVAYHPLIERIHPHGTHAVSGVEWSSWALVKRLHWAARTAPALGDTDSYSRRIVAALYRYAHATLPVVTEGNMLRGMFDHIPLHLPKPDPGQPPCPEDVIPPHERGELILPPGVVWDGD